MHHVARELSLAYLFYVFTNGGSSVLDGDPKTLARSYEEWELRFAPLRNF